MLMPNRFFFSTQLGNACTVDEHNKLLDLAIGAEPVGLLSHNEGVLESWLV